MPGGDEILRVVAEWVEKAESDLRAAVHTLKLERDCPTDTICFHAQQCVEKYLKAMLVLHSTPFRKTHNLFEIVELLPDPLRPDVRIEDLRRFNAYATITRYPGEYEPIDISEARGSIKIARKIRLHVRANLPPAALRRRRR